MSKLTTDARLPSGGSALPSSSASGSAGLRAMPTTSATTSAAVRTAAALRSRPDGSSVARPHRKCLSFSDDLVLGSTVRRFSGARGWLVGIAAGFLLHGLAAFAGQHALAWIRAKASLRGTWPTR